MADPNAAVMTTASPLDDLELASVEGVARLSPVPIGVRLVFRGAPPEAAELGLAPPPRVNTSANEEQRTILRLGPDEWLLLDAGGDGPGLVAQLPAMSGPSGAVVDVSHRAAGLALDGPAVEDVLAAGCPLPLDEVSFPPGRATRTLIGKAEVVLWRRGAGRFHIEVARSFAAYVAAFLGTAIASEAAIRRQAGR